VAKDRPVDEEVWASAFEEDLQLLAQKTSPRPLRSIYFGGGTPSLMPPQVAERVFSAAARWFGIEPGAELTVEANPDDRLRFEGLRALGFNRLSLGVQSIRDDSLRFLGRVHGAEEAKTALARAADLFPSVSADLIYALPDQTATSWCTELEEVLSYSMGHLSLYQLTIEPGTAFGKAEARGALRPMPSDLQAELYELTGEVTAAAGLPAYEVSNHARPGAEAVHNSLYWQGAEWLAIGPGAHGRLGQGGARLASEGRAAPKTYPLLPLEERLTFTPLAEAENLMEVLSAGLRPALGLEIKRLGGHARGVLEAAAPFIESGHLRYEDGRLFAAPEGRLLLDYLTAELALALPDPSV
jgi:oxygen-independent coproporphyrinogen-3 oxidase